MHENVGTNTVTVIFELPGVKKTDVNIEVVDGRISISGELKVPQEYNGSNFMTHERKFGRFLGRWHLPMGVPVSSLPFCLRVAVQSGDALTCY